MESIHEIRESAYLKLGIILIITGLLFALDSLFNLNFIYKFWPVLTAITGIGFIGIFKSIRKKGIFYLIIGEYLFCFSILALLCNFTSWTILSNLWPIFITFTGLVLVTVFLFRHEKITFFIIGIILILFSIYLYLLLLFNGGLWWTIFIIIGIFIIIIRKKY